MKSLLGMMVLAGLVGCGGAVRLDGDDDDGAGGGPDETSVGVTTGGGEGGDANVDGEGGDAEPPPPVQESACERMANVWLDGVEVFDAGGDGLWTPGEGATVRVHLFHASGQMMTDYPGVVVTSDHPYVWSQAPSNYLFGLNPEESTWLDIPFEAFDVVEPGTRVTLTVSVDTIVEPCPGLDTTDVQVDIVAPAEE